jgi:uncharacterized membrane protein YfcA
VGPLCPGVASGFVEAIMGIGIRDSCGKILEFGLLLGSIAGCWVLKKNPKKILILFPIQHTIIVQPLFLISYYKKEKKRKNIIYWLVKCYFD